MAACGTRSARDPRAGPKRVRLLDGQPAEIRLLGPDDRADVERLHRELPEQDQYLRFFTISRNAAARVAETITGPDSVAFGLFREHRLQGVAYYRGEGTPELAIAVAHPAQHHGVATALLRELVAHARRRGVRRLTAEVLVRNASMLRVIRESGLPTARSVDSGVVHLVLDTAESRSPEPAAASVELTPGSTGAGR